MAQILWFENYQPADAPVLGGKNASLGTLLTAGLPVPPGFAVSADCYRKALADGGLAGQLDALVAAADPREPTSVAAASVLARYVALAEVPAAVRVRTNAGCPMNDRKSPQPNPLHPAKPNAPNRARSGHETMARPHDRSGTTLGKHPTSCVFSSGAGDGNRTRTISLGS